MIRPNKKQLALVWNCIEMLETYREVYSTFGNDISKQYKLNEGDQRFWQNTLYEPLVASNLIHDDRFFVPDGTAKNYGLGNDFVATKMNYCNIMYQLYKTAACGLEFEVYDETATLVIDCIRMLEPYIYTIAGHAAGHEKVRKMGPDDIRKWQEVFLPKLVRGGPFLPDGTFFSTGASAHDIPNCGIGADGLYHEAAIPHFLSQCYKYLLKNAV
ncbi:hypothetical protein C4J81_09675 [Deltaproteobacteria bacterium Smac51]|nr:hypothetical protein C4J81_09675 [Deltaproteobacteria bacterium Smac51]